MGRHRKTFHGSDSRPGAGAKNIRLRSSSLMVPVAEEKEESSESDADSEGAARTKSIADKSVLSEGTNGEMTGELSRAPSRGTIFSVRSGIQSTGRSCRTQMSAFLAHPDAPMPVQPWCSKCLPVRPDGFLALKPDEINIVSSAQVKAISRTVERRVSAGVAADDVMQLQAAGGHGVSEGLQTHAERLSWMKGKPLFKENIPRMPQLSKKLDETALQPTAFSQLTVNSIEELELLGTMTRSRFSAEPYDGPDRKMMNEGDDLESEAISVPPILRALETRQVSNLDRFCQNHVKQQYVTSSAAANVKNPREGKRAKNTFTFGSVLQLLKGKQEGTNTEQENWFLMERLKQAPFLSEIPENLLEDVVNNIEGESFASGRTIFRESDEADTIIVVLQGEIELTSENSDNMGADRLKEAPVTLGREDIIASEFEKSRPFLLRPADERMHSQQQKQLQELMLAPRLLA